MSTGNDSKHNRQINKKTVVKLPDSKKGISYAAIYDLYILQ